MLHGAVEHIAHLNPFELGVGAADLVRHRAVVLAIARADRLIQGQRHIGRPHLHCLRHVVWRDAQTIRQLGHRRLASELVLHLLVDADDRLVELLQAARKTDSGALVAKVTLDLARDREGREGRELIAEVGIEALDGLDQAEIADLDDVVQRFAAVDELPRQEVDEVVVGVDQLGANAVALGRVRRFLVPAMERPQLLARYPPR